MQSPQQCDEQDAHGQTIDTTLNEFRGVLNIRISTIDEVMTTWKDQSAITAQSEVVVVGRGSLLGENEFTGPKPGIIQHINH